MGKRWDFKKKKKIIKDGLVLGNEDLDLRKEKKKAKGFFLFLQWKKMFEERKMDSLVGNREKKLEVEKQKR